MERVLTTGQRLTQRIASVDIVRGSVMVLMALLVHVPVKLVTAISLLLIVGHNLLDAIRPESFGAFAGLWHMLHVPGFAIPNVLFVAYPIVPWVGVMALGYVLAGVYQWDAARRRSALIWSGVAAVVLFVLLRSMNGYGNPAPWSTQRTPALTMASFLNVLKYPASLHSCS